MKFLIWSWEHNMWWRPNHAGYTELVEEAGRYSLAEAAEITVPHYPPGEEVAVIEEWALREGPPYRYDKGAP